MRSKIAVSLSMATLIAAAACSSPSPTSSPAVSSSAAPQFDSFEKIGDAIGCLSMSNSQPETTDIKENKYCTLEHPTEKNGQVTVYQYADVAHRDKSLRAGLVYEQSFLVVSETWAIAGDVKDLRKIKATLNTGDLRTAEPDASSSASGDQGVGPGDEEPSLNTDAKVVPLGKSATYQDERVQVGKIYCNDIGGKKNANQQYNSCRVASLNDGYDEVIKAPKGKEIFLVAFRWRNIGKAPVDPTDFGDLETEDGVKFAADTDLSGSLTTNARGNKEFDTSSKMNPGTSGRILLAYTIPKGTKVSKVYWGMDDYSQDFPAYALQVK